MGSMDSGCILPPPVVAQDACAQPLLRCAGQGVELACCTLQRQRSHTGLGGQCACVVTVKARAPYQGQQFGMGLGGMGHELR